MVLCVASAAAAQQGTAGRPDFNGTWERDNARSERPSGGGAATMIVTQTSEEMTTRLAQAEKWIQRYRFDGTETANETPFDSSKAKAEWKDTTLVLTSASTPRLGKPYTLITRYKLNADRTELIAEMSQLTADGKQRDFTQYWVKQVKK